MNESIRIATLREYEILDTPKEAAFDLITQLATKILNVPMALISLIDTDRIWFKSTQGIALTEISKEEGLCVSAIMGKEIYMVENASTDSRTMKNSLVTSEFGVQFYASMPLTVKNGVNLGTLFIADTKPRTLTPHEQDLLKDLADLVVEQLEIQLCVQKSVAAQLEMSNMLQAIYESTQEASAFIDTELKVRYSNQASRKFVKQLFGKEEKIGENVLEYVLPQYRAEYKSLFNRVLKGERIELEKYHDNTWWRIAIYPVYCHLRSIVGLAHNAQDITNEKTNFLKLVQQNELLKKITWQQCHEVRGPVANILGFCSLLKDNPDLPKEEKETYINHLFDAAKDLDKIIHQIVTQSIVHYKQI
ncbi:GAF domain-containing protein [Flavobacterium sp. SM2513]|uniref:GAF domain-containing protein n=1 Tax=Flavobacterium sp. SM2513 TaxID=3424766 RepID=UPI003D7F1A58